MLELIPSRATICIVNYRTLDLTRLCLGAIRRFTTYPHDIVVVDNDSRDVSVAFLRELPSIKLIERQPGADDGTGGRAHGAALDMALEACRTEFFVSLHSDTIVLREGWLQGLIERFEGTPSLACIGTDKIELKPHWQLLLKRATDLKALLRFLLSTPEERSRYRPFSRTICSVYRTEVLRREGLSFALDPSRHYTVGQRLHFDLLDRGYQVRVIPQRQARHWVVHLAHATVNANAAQFARTDKKVAKFRRRHRRALRQVPTDDLIASLDRI